MKKLLACSVIVTIVLGGCNSAKQLPREIVFVPDISQSIEADAERQMFVTIEDIASRLHRGDTLTIIPITGDAESELQGRILHYAVPRAEDRQAYDGDLRKLDEQIRDDLARLQADALAHPGKHTDILGSIRVAAKVFSDRGTDKRLVVLSDFIQDDDQYKFNTDRRLDNPKVAVIAAGKIASEFSVPPSIRVVLGRMKSSEFARLPLDRRRAVDAFWGRLLHPAVVDADGAFSLKSEL